MYSKGIMIIKIREWFENVINEKINGIMYDKRESYFLKYCVVWEVVGVFLIVSIEGVLINC